MKRYDSVETGEEPVAPALIGAVLRLPNNGSAETARLTTLAKTARLQVERHCRISVVLRTVTLFLDGFATRNRDGVGWWDGVRELPISELYEQRRDIRLPLPPLVSVTSITTYDDSDVGTVFGASAYYVDTASPKQLGRVVLRNGAVWPVGLRVANSVKIVYEAGYTDGSVPQDIIDAITGMAAYLYSNPGACSGDCSEACGMAGLLRSFVIMDPR